MLCQRRLWRWRGRWLADPLSARLFAFASNYALPPDTGVPTRRPPGSYYGSLIVSYVTPREVTEEAPHAIIDRIIASRANWIRGTPSLLEHFAERVSAAEAARLRDARISFVECTGENLSEAVRQQLSTTFGARIVNLYAAREVWPIACECEFGTLHTEEGHVRLELLNENQYERGGEVCVTALNLRTFPFVRYALGDVVELSSDGCGCGRNGEIVKSIRGRVGQMFSIGRHKYSANVFSDAVKEATALGFVALGRFQVFERHEGSFVYRIERRAALSGGEEEYLSKRLTERLGRTIVIAIEWCDEIPAQTGEKRTFFFGKGD
jgi:phenylacetate-CoA ligase